MPLVSIIIPAFRAERVIDAALQSVRTQTHADLEIIVVDDASPDATADHVAHHVAADHRVRLVRLPRNSGQSAAVNRGLGEARGDYIKFFDADDLLSPEAVAVQVAALAAKPRHLAYAAWGRFYTDPSETRFTPHPGWHDSDNALDWLIETWRDTEPMYQCALFLIPRALITEVGGWDERLGLINDFEFFTRLVLASDGIRFTPEAKLCYRSGLDGSLSGLKSRQGCESASLSVQLGIHHLLARERSPRTLRVAADILQSHVLAFYPGFPDLLAPCLDQINRLGGSSLQPKGGRLFQLITALCGWRTALRLRRAVSARRS
ncbi:MAG: glycosyltransferase family 2 protein [Opitutaceae bacterium]|nr:glycosyltransferase family 2 protein [Opitutaceae bacterium]